MKDLKARAQIWEKNLVDFTLQAKSRGWDIDDLQKAKAISDKEIKTLEKKLKQKLPDSIRDLLSLSKEWKFAWSVPKGDPLPKNIHEFYSGGIREVVWSADIIDWAHQSFSAWPHSQQKKWQGHFPIYHLNNGDVLTLNLNESDPQKQSLHYFSHEDESYQGHQIAANLFQFLDRWSEMGCAGSVYWQWVNWLQPIAKSKTKYELDPKAESCQKFLAWFHEKPKAGKANTRPKLIDAKSKADIDLLKAASDGTKKEVLQALKDGAQIDASDNDNWQNEFKSAIVFAAIRGNLEILETLKEKGASLSGFRPPLTEAMLDASPEALIWMMKNGAQLNSWEPEDPHAIDRLFYRYRNRSESDPAKQISEDEFLNLLETYLKSGGSPEARTQEGRLPEPLVTPLMQASIKAMALLLKYKADVTITDHEGRNALFFVGSSEKIQMLTKAGLDLNALSTPKDNPEAAHTPLMALLKDLYDEPPVKQTQAFLDSGADPKVKDPMGRDAWWYVRNIENAKQIEKVHPLKPSTLKSGDTIVLNLFNSQSAIYQSQIPLLEFFAKKKVDLNAKDKSDETVLHKLAPTVSSDEDLEVFKALIDLGADPKLKNKKGKTAKDLLKKKFAAKV